MRVDSVTEEAMIRRISAGLHSCRAMSGTRHEERSGVHHRVYVDPGARAKAECALMDTEGERPAN